MAAALIELEQVLRSNQKERMTGEEASVIGRCKGIARRKFLAGAFSGGGLAWAATRTRSRMMQLSLSAGVAMVTGFWKFHRSLNSSLDDILSQTGSRMQSELASIILQRYRSDFFRMQLLTKRFFLEKVFDDQYPDHVILRLRHRNVFHDGVYNGKSSEYGDYDVASDSNPQNDSRSVSDNNNSKSVSCDGSDTSLVHNQVNMDDPLECVLGSTTSTEEIHNNASPKNNRAAHRRSQRKRRIRRREKITSAASQNDS